MSSAHPVSNKHLLFAILLTASLFLGASTLQDATQPPPFMFNHQKMVESGITCLFCHTDARRSPAAGMPSMQKCMGCHDVIATDDEAIQTLTDYWQRQQPILWERHLQLPRFVYFSHRMHVAVAGLNCERCHGDVANMTVALPVEEINMGWCLDCHDEQENAQQLADCIVCHQ
jgi:hypothetical protein